MYRCFNFQFFVSSTHIDWCFIYKEDPANLPYSKPWGVVLCVWAAEKNIIDCRHLNERLWIKVIAAQCTVACVGNGWGRIIRHEYSAKHSRSPVFTGQSSSNVWQSSGAGNPSTKSVEKSDVEIHWKMCQEMWYRCLLSGEIGEIQQREIDWLKRPGQSVSIASVILKCLAAYHFCKKFQGNWNLLFWRFHSFFWTQRLMIEWCNLKFASLHRI